MEMYQFTSWYLVADGNGGKHIIFQPTNEGIKNDEKLMSKFAIHIYSERLFKEEIDNANTYDYIFPRISFESSIYPYRHVNTLLFLENNVYS